MKLKNKVEIKCKTCEKTFSCYLNLVLKYKRKYCSKVCAIKGNTNIRLCHLGKPSWNKGLKISGMSGNKQSIKWRQRMTGQNHPRWISDRSKLKRHNRRNDMAYKEWRKQVWLRDKFVCKIANPNCNGRIEAHHILSWRDYPELRYEVNNGITLCHAHHPRKKEEEAKLSPYFKELVAEMN